MPVHEPRPRAANLACLDGIAARRKSDDFKAFRLCTRAEENRPVQLTEHVCSPGPRILDPQLVERLLDLFAKELLRFGAETLRKERLGRRIAGRGQSANGRIADLRARVGRGNGEGPQSSVPSPALANASEDASDHCANGRMLKQRIAFILGAHRERLRQGRQHAGIASQRLHENVDSVVDHLLARRARHRRERRWHSQHPSPRKKRAQTRSVEGGPDVAAHPEESREVLREDPASFRRLRPCEEPAHTRLRSLGPPIREATQMRPFSAAGFAQRMSPQTIPERSPPAHRALSANSKPSSDYSPEATEFVFLEHAEEGIVQQRVQVYELARPPSRS